ncbi:nucleotidyl transferase AbiEii/AbiGii toxin family protein [candidate division KSB1 bacterium]|nr:nucleotidyl transferase AbiEii/AbiGii toxin family protein [candidate division KSB1 bacterium]
MFEQALSGNTKTVLALLGDSDVLAYSYLAGGTGIALQLGHRISIDLDFFTPEEFDIDALVKRLNEINQFTLEEKKWGTVTGEFGEVKFSIFVYQYPVILPFKSFLKVNIMDVREIAAMKLEAIATRGKKRDFIDLYFVVQGIEGLKGILSLYNKKYGKFGNKMVHIMKGLTYFEDAEAEELPRMLVPVDWKEVKRFFEEEVRKIGREFLEGG